MSNIFGNIFSVNSIKVEKLLATAVDILKNNGVVAAPTETVYGLFADAYNDAAILEIYNLKGRPSHNPLIAHVSGIDMAKEFAEVSQKQESIMKIFWEELAAPITFILQKKDSRISEYMTAGLKTVAVRRPNHAVALGLIEKFGGVLAAPSANKSNFLSPTSAQMVQNDFGENVPMIIDGGLCKIGLESTIVDISTSQYILLRQGGVSQKEIESVVGHSISLIADHINIEKILAPGMMKKHYAPKLPLRINVLLPFCDEAFIAFGQCNISSECNLSLCGDLNEAAKNLFCSLLKVDDPAKYKGIAVMPVPNVGIGIAINDRLMRASA